MTRPLPRSLAVAFGLVALASLLVGNPAVADDDGGDAPSIESLAWLVGGWRAEGGSFEEYWSPPRGGTLIGMARFFRGDRVTMTELISIADAGDKGIIYSVRHFGIDLRDHPAGAAAFRLDEAGEGRAVFVLPENDFPSKITYARDGEKLVVTLEGEQGGRPVKQAIPMTRIPMDAAK